MPDVAYLVCVSPDGNHNKYYKMIPKGDSFDVEFGRVGAGSQTSSYPISLWDKKFKEKIAKGYVDMSAMAKDLFDEESDKSDIDFSSIKNESVADIVKILYDSSRQRVRQNYKISARGCTQSMIDEAQGILDSMTADKTVEEFNEHLLRLFSVIPRRMSNVREHLIRSESDMASALTNEQDLLDAMRGQVVKPVEHHSEKSVFTLDDLGFEIDEASRNDIDYVRSMLGSCNDKFSRLWRVKNTLTQDRYDKYVTDNHIEEQKDLFHGSRTENWWNILRTGLVLRPTNVVMTGSMFGHGIYFAPKAQKSLGYTSMSGSYWTKGSSTCGYMAVMRTAYGKPCNVYEHNSSMCSIDYDELQRRLPGANCLHAHAGKSLRNDEIIFYKEEQITIRYLVELRA